MSKKRATPTTPTTDGDEESKRLRRAIDHGLEELVCSITYELPLDPVTAEDGKIYERAAIADWLKNHDKSPSTNEPMGKKLMPALQIKNMIEKLVQSGAIDGDKADAWKRMKSEEDVAATLRRAENGDASAIQVVLGWYTNGKNGVAKDLVKATDWCKRGANVGNPVCMLRLADAHLRGYGGVVKNVGLAVHWTTMAATEGKYAPAAAVLGFAFAPAHTRPLTSVLSTEGTKLGLLEDVQLATAWLRKAVSFGRSLQDKGRKEEILQEILDWLQKHAVD